MSSEASTTRAAQDVFVRRSSGLTRQVSGVDALMYCAMNPGLLYAFVYAMFTVPLFAAYGGPNLPVAVLPVLMMFPIAGLYWYYSVAMPRSGGEYIYISRTLHPALGLFACWMISITGISWLGLLTDWWLKWSIADSFRAHGIMTGNEGLVGLANTFEGTHLRAVLGTVALLLTYYIFLKGAKAMMRLSYVAVIVSWLALILLAIAVFTTGRSEFAANFDRLTGASFSEVVRYASESNVARFTFMATLLAGATYVVLNTLGATFSANMAGEIRGVSRSQALALFGSLVIQMITWAVAYWLIYAVAGSQFWHGLTTSWLDGATTGDGRPIYPFGGGGGLGDAREPFPTLLFAFMNTGPLLIYLFALMFLLSTFISAAGLAFGPLRNVFAWSFDRLLPTKFAEMDRRFRAPVLACAAVVLAAWIFFIIDVYRPTWTSYIAFTIVGWFIGWIFLGIAGMVFPVVRPQLYEGAPPQVQRAVAMMPVVVVTALVGLAAVVAVFAAETATFAEQILVLLAAVVGVAGFWWVGGRLGGMLPYISILGYATLIVSGFVEWATLKPFFQGAVSWSAMLPIPFMMAAPIIIYAVASYSARRRDIPLSLQFAEVPPE